jgi:hypothetical protein
LTLSISENTGTIDINSHSNVNILLPIIENNSNDNADEENDIDPDHLTGLKIEENYTEDSNILENNSKLRNPKEPIIHYFGYWQN